MIGEKIETLMHRRKRRRGARRCSRRKCSLRIPLLGICLWSSTVRVKCKRKKRSRRR